MNKNQMNKIIKKTMNIGIITMERYESKPFDSVGSSRIRAKWLTNYWNEAELFVQGKPYDIVIYSKAYWTEHAKVFKGFKILDLCDPDWLHWGYRTKEMIEEVDVITVSTEELKKSIEKFSGGKPVIHVPDRLDLEFHKQRKIHVGDAKKVVWFGYSTGFDMVNSALESLKKRGLDLIVIANKPFIPQVNYRDVVDVTNYPWKLETVNSDMIKADIVINPQSKTGKWKYKSNNKTITAWSLGLPVAYNDLDIDKFITEESRQDEAKKRLKEVKEKYDIKKSVETYKEIIEKYNKG